MSRYAHRALNILFVDRPEIYCNLVEPDTFFYVFRQSTPRQGCLALLLDCVEPLSLLAHKLKGISINRNLRNVVVLLASR